MSRLSPLIVRRPGPLRLPAYGSRSGQATAAAVPFDRSAPFENVDAGRWLDDLRQFATGWLGGLVFFGTFIA